MRGNGLNRVFIDFNKVKSMTLGELYGDKPVPIAQLTKRLWAVIREHGLMVKRDKDTNATNEGE